MATNWHAWTIVNTRYKKVLSYLEESSIVEEFIYPTAEKEYNTKKGRRKKHIPIYANYIFMKYNHTAVTMSQLEECPWILYYIGECTDKEINQIKELDSKDYNEVVPRENIPPGTVVKLIATPFDGWEAAVIEQIGDKLLVSITIFGGERIIQCKIDDINTV